MIVVNGKNASSRFSSTVYRGIVALLAVGGMIAALQLAISHYRNFNDIGYQSFCAISRALNCDTVSQSLYAIFWDVPVAIWGAFGYLLFLLSAFFFSEKTKMNRGWSSLFLLSSLFSLVSIRLAIVSSVYIHSYCLMCMVTYAINFALLFFCGLAVKRFGPRTWMASFRADWSHVKTASRESLYAGMAVAMVTVGLHLFYPNYWHYNALPLDTSGMHHGVTEDGSPWIGAQDPRLTITEFTDYFCFQCGKMHSYLRQLIDKYPDRIRLIHRHFPLDRQVNPVIKETLHPNSGLVSLFAIYAEQSGHFWQVNDRLFRDAREKKTIAFGDIAKETGLDLSTFQDQLSTKVLGSKLIADIKLAAELGVTGTPTYLIDGKIYTGTIPETILSRIIQGDD